MSRARERLALPGVSRRGQRRPPRPMPDPVSQLLLRIASRALSRRIVPVPAALGGGPGTAEAGPGGNGPEHPRVQPGVRKAPHGPAEGIRDLRDLRQDGGKSRRDAVRTVPGEKAEAKGRNQPPLAALMDGTSGPPRRDFQPAAYYQRETPEESEAGEGPREGRGEAAPRSPDQAHAGRRVAHP